MDPVSVAVVSSRVEADIVAGLLRSYGLKVGVTADDVGAQEPHLQQHGVHVMVAAADEAAARRILAARR